ncbi:MAG: hypothetical protein ACFHU9_13145 [Fluviicola sp.]
MRNATCNGLPGQAVGTAYFPALFFKTIIIWIKKHESETIMSVYPLESAFAKSIMLSIGVGVYN